MPTGLKRFQQTGDLHFITVSCFRHRQLLGTPEARNILQTILEQTRIKYDFNILGYVIMPDHAHLLVSEPTGYELKTAMQVIKQRYSRTRSEGCVWEERYHDFNVFSEEKRIEKLRYIHRNPVKRALVAEPDQWPWSSFRAYAYQEPNPVTIARSWA